MSTTAGAACAVSCGPKSATSSGWIGATPLRRGPGLRIATGRCANFTARLRPIYGERIRCIGFCTRSCTVERTPKSKLNRRRCCHRSDATPARKCTATRAASWSSRTESNTTLRFASSAERTSSDRTLSIT
uniref:(northern house mosquito) hypothetical protein n=1 Tax=Culex pipiens TaxID=7175 RepID=A0A8D8DGF2_CULPI